MRRYSALLLTTMLFPASSHAATLHFYNYDIVAPHAEFYTIDATYSPSADAVLFTSISQAGTFAYSKTITQVDSNSLPIQKATFDMSMVPGSSPVPPNFLLPVLIHTGLTSVTFTLVEGINHFNVEEGFLVHGLTGGVSYVATFHTPIPAALPLFVAGLGMLGWFTRKRNPVEP